MKEDLGKDLYLGMPILVGHRKIEIFNYLKEKLQERMMGW